MALGSRSLVVPATFFMMLMTESHAIAQTDKAGEKASAAVVNAIARDYSQILKVPAMFKGKGGDRVWVQSLEVLAWDGKTLDVTMRLRYEKTRGFPHFSTSGTALGHFRLFPGTKAEFCADNLTVSDMNLNRMPKWFTNKWLQDKLNKKMPSEVCAQ
jgi:hypothetical protein